MYEIKIQSVEDRPHTDNAACREWNTVASRATWKAALRAYESWTNSHGYDHNVEVYWVGDRKTGGTFHHRFHAADCRPEPKTIAEVNRRQGREMREAIGPIME